jgi:hypothetical protein
MDVMKRLLFLLGCSGALLCAADLSHVRNVYVMPMAKGLDQYLASRITSAGLFQVVTDPKLADAILSDRVGENLQTQLEKIFPTPKPEEVEEEQPAPAKNDKGEPIDRQNNSIAAAMAETEGKAGNMAQSSSFGRSKGNIFLVEAKTRLVLWSIYDPPKSGDSKELDHIASDIVSRLKKDMTPKKQKQTTASPSPSHDNPPPAGS